MFFDFGLLPARFWTNFGSKMVEVLLWKAVLRALPRPNQAPKAVRSPLVAPLEPIWANLCIIFADIWRDFFGSQAL